MINRQYDVIIVGYGPVGVTLANLLGQQGCHVAVFEREQSVYHQPRASHMDAEVMRVYQSVGLAHSLESIMVSTKGTFFYNQDNKLLLELKREAGAGPLGWDHHYRFYQPALEEALREGVKRFDNVDVFLGYDVVGVESDEDGATATVKNLIHGAKEQFTAQYVVGCDGARSLVRNVLGNDVQDLGFHQPWLVIDIQLTKTLDLPETAIQFCNPARPITYVPMIGSYDRYRWEIMLMPGDEKQEMERPEKVWELISPWVNPENAVIERATVYTFHSILAKDWRKGRLLLAGDSAHQTPPFLGQGLCAGIRDVSNLAWKLTMVLQRQAPQGLLDSYGSERIPHVRKFIDMSIELGKVITARTPDEVRKRDQSPPKSLSEPAPSLGKGLHGESPSPAGALFPQPRMKDGRLLDDVINGIRFAVIGYPDIVNQVSQDVKEIWSKVNAAIITELCPEIENWLEQQNGKALILRPDRYVLSVANDSEQLERQSAVLSFSNL